MKSNLVRILLLTICFFNSTIAFSDNPIWEFKNYDDNSSQYLKNTGWDNLKNGVPTSVTFVDWESNKDLSFIVTINTDQEDGAKIPVKTIKKTVGNNDHWYMAFGNDNIAIKSIEFTSTECASMIISRLTAKLWYTPSENYWGTGIGQTKDSDITATFKFDNFSVGPFYIQEIVNFTTDSNIYNTEQKFTPIQPDKLTVIIDNPQNNKGVIAFEKFVMEYTNGQIRSDAGLAINLFANKVWDKSVVWYDRSDGGFSFNENLDMDKDITFSVKPLFSPKDEIAPDDNTDDTHFYSDSEASVTRGESDFTLNVPCSGLYEITMSTKGNSKVKESSVSKIVNIYPSFEGLEINWQKIPIVGTDPVTLYPMGTRDLTNALVTISTIGHEIFYKVSGIPDSSYLLNKVPEDDDSYSIHSIPDDFITYDKSGAGINMAAGNTLQLFFRKNGAVTPQFTVFYTKGNISTNVENPSETFPGSCTFHTFDGLPVATGCDGVPSEPGVYIKISGNKSEKVMIK